MTTPATTEPDADDTVSTHLRLTPRCRALLDTIAKERGLRYAAIVVETLAREEAERRGLVAP